MSCVAQGLLLTKRMPSLIQYIDPCSLDPTHDSLLLARVVNVHLPVRAAWLPVRIMKLQSQTRSAAQGAVSQAHRAGVPSPCPVSTCHRRWPTLSGGQLLHLHVATRAGVRLSPFNCIRCGSEHDPLCPRGAIICAYGGIRGGIAVIPPMFDGRVQPSRCRRASQMGLVASPSCLSAAELSALQSLWHTSVPQFHAWSAAGSVAYGLNQCAQGQ